MTSRVQGNKRGTTTGSSIAVTLDSAPTAGNVLIACIATLASINDTVASISQTGVTWKLAKAIYNYASLPEFYVRTEIWYGAVGAGASASLTVNLTGNADSGGVADICEYSGVGPNVYVDAEDTFTGNSDSPYAGPTGTTAQASELVIAATAIALYSQSTPQSGFNLLDGAVYQSVSLAYLEKIVTSTASFGTGTTAAGSSYWAGVIVTFASCIDGSVEAANSGTTITLPITTVNPDDVIIVAVGTINTQANGTYINVSGNPSSSPSLTWTRRKQQHARFGTLGNYTYHDLEEWWAYAGSNTGLITVTVTLTGTPNSIGWGIAFGVSGIDTTGATPYDPNAGLPAAGSGTAANPSESVSTTHANDFIFGLLINNDNGHIPTAGSGFTGIQLGYQYGSEYKTVSSAQSSSSVGFTEVIANWVEIADALVFLSSTGPTLVTVTDTLSLSDTVLTNKKLSVVDSLGLNDSPRANKKLGVSDALSIVDSALSLKKLQASDLLSLVDAVLTNKSVQVSDVISLLDAALAAKKLSITDAIAILDNVYANKTLQVSDVITLLDAVNVRVTVEAVEAKAADGDVLLPPVLRYQKATYSGLKLVGSVKHRTSASLVLKGQILHNARLSAELRIGVQQRSTLKACMLGTCLHPVSLEARLRGHNYSLVTIWFLLEDAEDEDDDEE